MDAPLDEKYANLIGEMREVFSTRQTIARTNFTYCGFETRTDPAQYHWDGLKRGADVAHPYLVFQYTLDGLGHFTRGKQTQQIVPGMAFNAFIPSAHAYYLPSESQGWSFFWLLLHHPYIVDRVARRIADTGEVFSLDLHDPLFTQSATLFKSLCLATFTDSYAEEQALFEFMLEYERFSLRTSTRQSARNELLEEVRAYVLRSLKQPVSSAELGRLHHMSRSNFTHYFTRATGISPARYVRSIRLEEAANRLLHTDQKLDFIAHETGFADANHFCKAFRREYHLSPGQYRRQLKVD